MKELTFDEARTILTERMRACDNAKKARLDRVIEMEQAYYSNRYQPNIKGRSNIPLPFFAKYIDELKARLDEAPLARFHWKKKSQILVAKKVSSAFEIDRAPERMDLNRNDRMEKTLAIFQGIGAHDSYAEEIDQDGQLTYMPHYEALDLADLYFEPTGGSNPEDHNLVGKGNAFRSRDYIDAMVNAGAYDRGQCEMLFRTGAGSSYKETRKVYADHWTKTQGLQMNLDINSYIGGEWYPLAYLQFQYGMKRYYAVVEMVSGIVIRLDYLKDVFGSNLYTIGWWQTHEDPHNLLCKSPADDMWPLCELLRSQGNYMIDAFTKYLWGQRAVDPNFFPDPSQLYWNQPDQIIEAVAYQGKPVQTGVYEFKSGAESITAGVPFMKYWEDFLASVAGVTPNTPSNEEERVGVLFGQLQKASARLGVYNKSYNESFNRFLVRYVWGLKTFLDEPMMVKLIGEEGVEWEELTSSEFGGPQDFDIECIGSNIELEMSEARKKRQQDALTTISKDPNLSKELNTRVTVEEFLRGAEFKDDSIKRITDVQNYGAERIISHASMAIEQLLRGKKTPKPYQGADDAFLQYGYDYLVSNDLDHDKFMAIQEYFRGHIPIVVRNMAIRAAGELVAKGTPMDAIKAPGTPNLPNGAPAGALPAPAPAGNPMVPGLPAQAPATPPMAAGAGPAAVGMPPASPGAMTPPMQ